ncbi:tetratricopeptide repeat-containing glycosyltransferase family protein [Paraburkholderia sp. J7]|uniref:tetratricopeptide repeat-containing glycosyltransferase family protein n=1 Tax=Paraburkholderia sp. J7 TaxID=2805438 RepID=UPI002AB69E89|nr:tetratricopeptide repeat-containing glycosyltransferase family protein [Paraburkholderia sp. J7]
MVKHRIAAHAGSRGLSLHEIGHAHYRRGDIEAAEAVFRQVLEVEPEWLRAKLDLGCILQKRRSYAEAEVLLRQVLAEDPDAEYAHNALGLALWSTERLEEAETHFREAIRLYPDFYQAQNNLGLLLTVTNNLREAQSAFRRALSIHATSHEIYSNLGSALWQSGEVEAAIRAHRQALALKPDFSEAKINLAHPLLAIGEYTEGWARYESRYDTSAGKRYGTMPPASWPMWNGESLVGKSLLIWPEQGYGDMLQFCRYAPMLKKLGVQKLSVLCPPALVRLFESLNGVDFVYAANGQGSIPTHDFWCFMMSLPHRLGTTVETIPAAVPYLHPPASLVSVWHKRLPKKQFQVGLVWAGDPRPQQPASNAMDRRRSIKAQSLLPILRVPGVSFVSLQKGESARRQIVDLPPELRPFDPMDDVEDFADTAAMIELLDLVITVDTSMAHLAGALNKPVWILSRYDACWRWLRDRADSPWYPSARLFRQLVPGNWDEVVSRVAQALHAPVQRRADSLGIT